MKLKEFLERLKKLNIPVAYRKFNKKTNPPSAVYFVENEDIWGADDINLLSSKEIIVELYTVIKDIELEERLEALFPEFEMEKFESYIKEEDVLQVAYHMKLITKRR